MKEKQTGRSDNGALPKTLGSPKPVRFLKKAEPKTFISAKLCFAEKGARGAERRRCPLQGTGQSPAKKGFHTKGE